MCSSDLEHGRNSSYPKRRKPGKQRNESTKDSWNTWDCRQNTTNDYTIEFWIKFTGTGGGAKYFISTPYISSAWFAIGFDYGTNTFTGFVGSIGFRNSSVVFNKNEWIHLAVVRKGTGVTLYANGVAINPFVGLDTHNYSQNSVTVS